MANIKRFDITDRNINLGEQTATLRLAPYWTLRIQVEEGGLYESVTASAVFGAHIPLTSEKICLSHALMANFILEKDSGKIGSWSGRREVAGTPGLLIEAMHGDYMVISN